MHRRLEEPVETQVIKTSSSQNAQFLRELSDVVFRLKLGTSIEPFDDLALLFSEDDQRLLCLNPSSAIFALQLTTGATVNELVVALECSGADPQQSLDWVATFLIETARTGVLAADCRAAPRKVAISQNIQIGALSIQLDYSCRLLSESIGSPYAHLTGAKAPAQCRFQIWKAGRFIFISNNSAPAQVVEAELAAVRLKGMVVEEVLGAASHLAALHAAYLAKDDHGLLLVGAPGAGKSTLTLALLQHGFRYASDDVALLRSDGSLTGVPLAPTVKSGSWEIVKRLGWTLSDLPAHLRPDGRSVRFAQLSAEVLASPSAIRTIVMLRRAPGEKSGMKLIHPAEALGHLMRESRSPSGVCTREILSGLANVVRCASSYTLSFSEAADTVPLLQAVTGND